MADAMIMRDTPVMMPASGLDIKTSSLLPIPSSPNCNETTMSGTGSKRNNSSNAAVLVKKFKGEKINCGDLRKYLYGFEIYRQASMLRKGREVHKIYVDVHKGVNFLDDRFSLTEFGRMVLDNGSVRAGRARNVRQIVVARETLYCSGTGGCKRACGGYGSCVSGCDKIKVRGHKCSFRVKLTMRLGFVDSWFVEILGSHNCYLAENTPSDLSSMASDYDVKNSDGEDSSSLRSSPLSDSNLFTQTQSGEPASFMSRTSPPSLKHLQTPTFPTILPSYPLNIPVFQESYLLTMARNAAALQHGSDSSKISRSLGKPILPLDLNNIKRDSVGSSDLVGPEIVNDFLPSALIPRYNGFPPPPVMSPQVLSNANYSRHPNLNSFTNQSSMDSFNDVIDLSKPRVKAEKDKSVEDDVKACDLSISLSPRNKFSPFSDVNDNNNPSVNTINLNGFHSLPVKSEHKSPSPVPKKYSNDVKNMGIFNIPNGLSTSHASVFDSITLPSSTSSSTLPPSNTTTSSSQPFSLSSSSIPAATSALSGKLCEKARKAICRRLDSHFLGFTDANSLYLKPENQQNANSDKHRGNVKEESGSNESQETVSMPTAVDDNSRFDSADYDCDIEADMDKDLVNRVHQLESHVTQLRNVILKKDGGKSEGGRKNKPQKQFDFKKYNTRHVALKIAYLGWDYHGFVVQEDSERTVEAALFEALIKVKLVENRETSNYHRCGRTDKGVSALGQVISLDLRTNLLEGVGVKVREGGTASTRQGDTSTEIRYVHMLNKVLPPQIRVLAWAPVPIDFSARFSCKRRTYKYFFPKGDMDIDLMNEAAHKLVGEHDFRNLCKMDVGNGVTNFMRKIISAEVSVTKDEHKSQGFSMCELTVVGQAFLWHQIRCIVAVLFLIAEGKEEMKVLDELLDVDSNPKKPQYSMASELPLNLYDCDYGDGLEWVYEADWHEDNLRHLQQMWAGHAIRATMLRRMLDELEVAKVETESDIAPWNELSAPLLQQSGWLTPCTKPRNYIPLFKRQMCESLEERMEHFAKRRKLTPTPVSENKEDERISLPAQGDSMT